MADIYRAQTAPGGTTALGGASPEAFGAAIGRGIQDVGSAVGQIEERRKARDRDSQNAAAALEFAKISTDLDKAEIDARDAAAPGAAGHSEAIGKLADDWTTKALGNIKDPKIREAYQVRYQELRGNVGTRAYGWERAAHTEKLVTDVAETRRILANGQANNPDAVGFEVSRNTLTTLWDNLDVSADTKAKGLRSDLRELALAYGGSLADSDPDLLLGNKEEKRPGVLEVISGDLNPEDIDRLRSRGQSELAALEAKQRREASVWEAKRRDEIATIGKRIGLNDFSIGDEEFNAAAADAEKMGDKTLGLDIANWRDLRDVGKATRDWTPAEWADEVGKLEAKGDKLTTGEAMRLTHLKQLRPAAEAKFNNSTDEWGNSNGDPMPDVDFSNGQGGDARIAWNDRMMKRGAKPFLLNKDELGRFQQRAGEGVAGQLEVAQTLRNTFGAGRGSMLAIQQIGGGATAQLKLMVGLPAHTAADYRLGQEAYSRNPKLINADVAREVFTDYSRGIPQELQGVVWDAGRAIAAAELNRAGVAEPDDDDFKRTFERALNRATGATGSGPAGGNGGFVRWGDRPLWIPPDMPKQEALRRLSRSSAAAIVAANVGADGTGVSGAPCYMGADGKPHRFDGKAADMLKRGTLETVAPGVFRVILEDGGHVINKNGQPWQFDIRKLK